MRKVMLLFVPLIWVLAACDSGAAAGDPAAVVMQYLEARVKSDEEALRNQTCAAEEAQVPIIANSFRGRDAQLQDVSCTTGEKDGDYTIIECTGLILASYQGEVNEFEVGSYRAIQEDGEWKVCGEAG